MLLSFRRRLAGWAWNLAFCSGALWAQTTGTGTLVGTVVDSTGAVVGAKVVVVNPANAFTLEVMTTGEGSYYIPYLAPATYRITVEMAGFKKYVREGVTIRTGEIPRAASTILCKRSECASLVD